MLKRNVVSRLGGELPDDERLSEGQEAIAQQKVADFKERIQQQKFAIVGFNVLNKTEQEMFKFLKENSQVYFYWDFDEAYQQQKADDHKVFEAGRFIYEDMQAFPNEFKPDTETYRLAYRNFASSKKHITYISSPTENAQTQYIGTWMQQCHLQAEGEPLNQSAIVLCNENLLQSVLHSIPVDEEFASRVLLRKECGVAHARNERRWLRRAGIAAQRNGLGNRERIYNHRDSRVLPSVWLVRCGCGAEQGDSPFASRIGVLHRWRDTTNCFSDWWQDRLLPLPVVCGLRAYRFSRRHRNMHWVGTSGIDEASLCEAGSG